MSAIKNLKNVQTIDHFERERETSLVLIKK
jgi:hypothetical protein